MKQVEGGVATVGTMLGPAMGVTYLFEGGDGGVGGV